jgi:hypothetical protein
MRGWWWLLGLLLVWIVAEGFLFKLHEAGVLGRPGALAKVY